MGVGYTIHAVLQIIGSIVLVTVIVIAVAVGVYVATKPKNKPTSKASTGGSGSTGSSSGGPANGTNPNDPSSFQKDPRLHQSFYGFAYTPEGSQLPDCGNKLGELCCFRGPSNLLMSKKLPAEQVITDIQLLSQLTTVDSTILILSELLLTSFSV